MIMDATESVETNAETFVPGIPRAPVNQLIHAVKMADASNKSEVFVIIVSKNLQKSSAIQNISITFARKDNSLRINRLVGLLENWVTR